MAVRELAEATIRADNPALLDALTDLGVDTAALVAGIDGGRADR